MSFTIALGQMRVDGGAIDANLARAEELITHSGKAGVSLIVFPEGTRSRDGRVNRFKGGSFYLALEAGLPVVPLSIVGSRHVMLKGRLTTYPGSVKLVVHDPIDTSGLAGSDPRVFGERVRQVLAPDAESDVTAVPPDADALHVRA